MPLGWRCSKRIGVWGMGGVGKTTLVRNLNNELSKDPTNLTFSIVILVEVSKNASVESVQSKIAERLHLRINKEERKGSVTSQLYNKLKGEKFLLILDDVWEEIDLVAVGIPRPNHHTGSKILLTTRDNMVCQQMLTDYKFEISCLSSKEASELFSQRVGMEVINDDQIRPLADAIVQECKGLPLAINIIGASLMGKTEIALWKNALYALQKSEPTNIRGVEKKVYEPLKLSYDSLEDELLKSCFLFFCLFPEDYEVDIDRLVQYWLAEGLLNKQLNYERLQIEVIRIVDNLKDFCLLESGLRPNTVKMHDVVRDVGVWIANSSEDGCKSVISAGISGTQISEQLKNCSDKVKRVSFMESNIPFLPNDNIQCPETTTLFLSGNMRLQEVPNSFLLGLQLLRILDLSQTKIKFLPQSLLQLGELRALLLKGCDELFELPCLAALGMLQVLDCSNSAITILPEDFEKLTNLRQLDLSHTRKLRKFPINKISNLCTLEYLNMTGSATKWGTRKTDEEIVSFEELLCLDRIVAFYIDLKDIPHVTPEGVSWLRRINNFIVNVIPKTPDHLFPVYKTYQPYNKSVFFYDVHFSGDEPVEWLLVNASDCKMMYCIGVDLMLGNLNPCVNLKCLCISRCYVSFKPSTHQRSAVKDEDKLPNLEKLIFHGLTGLESVSDFSSFLGLRFNKLKYIEVLECYELENLLTMDGALQKLEKVEVIRILVCEKLAEVFKNASTDNFVPKLKSLELKRLESLENICQANVSWPSLELLDVIECNVLRNLPLGLQNVESIQLIRGEQEWWNKLQWGCENSKICLRSHFKPC